jgi:hypothetical protein
MPQPLSEAEEFDLALELMGVSSEAELEQFLGNVLKGAWKGLKNVGSTVAKVARPLGGVLKTVAKTALPFVGGALGSFIPVPGVGTALGTALGSAVGNALELEMQNVSRVDRDLERARHFVRIAATAAQRAATAPANADPLAVVRKAVLDATRAHLPAAVPGASGRWIRRGQQIEIVGA